MFRIVVGLAVALIGIGAAGLRGYLFSNGDSTFASSSESTGSTDMFAGLIATLVGDEDAQGPEAPAGAEGVPSPMAVAAQFSQIQAILEEEMARAEQTDGAAGAFPAAAPQGPAVIAVPQVRIGSGAPAAGADCGLDGAATAGACPSATTGPASAAQVVVIRPRQ